MPERVNIGSFNRKISFCTLTSTKSGMGAPVKSYTHSFYCYMERIEAAPGQEQYINNRLVMPYRYTFRGHYKPTIEETMQMIDENVKYNILAVNPVQNKMFIEILAERITE